MKIAVTGGSGGLGGYVLRDLREAGHHAVNFDRKRADEGWTYMVEIADAAQVYDALADVRPDAVIHLAADPVPFGRPRHAQFANNVLGTHAVLQASADFGIKHFVFASSEMATGWTRGHATPTVFPLTESDTIVPINSYALGKRLGEIMCDSIAAAHQTMTLVSLRLNYVIHESGYRHLAGAREVFPSGSSNLWAYIDARDAASAARLSAELDRPGHHIFNVAAPDTYLDMPTREAVRGIGLDAEFREGWPEFGAPVDCSKIERELGWSARHTWRAEVALDGNEFSEKG